MESQNQRDRDVIDSLNAQLDALTKAKAEVDKTLKESDRLRQLDAEANVALQASSTRLQSQCDRDRDLIDGLNEQLDALKRAYATLEKTLVGEQDKNSELWSNCSSLKRQAN